MDSKNLSLYIHIPFCVRKCNYCDFLSFPSGADTRAQYTERLISEIQYYGELYKAYNVITIFIGGGTPSCLERGLIERIMMAVNECYNIADDAEITIECNPGTVDRDKLKEYMLCGINRISFGLQSVRADELLLLGRIHTFEEFRENYEIARDVGFRNINIDLMSALPGQQLSSQQESVSKVIELAPEHISCYSLILEEGTPFGKLYSPENLPDEELDRQMYYATREMLERSKYRQYEISNYAYEGYECRHNRVYWQRGNYLGMGLGAASMINNTRWKNKDTLTEYMMLGNGEHIDNNEYHRLDVSEQMSEYMFLGLRESDGVSIDRFYKEYGCSLDSVYGEWNGKMLETGLLICEDDMIRLSYKGMDLANYVMSGYV